MSIEVSLDMCMYHGECQFSNYRNIGIIISNPRVRAQLATFSNSEIGSQFGFVSISVLNHPGWGPGQIIRHVIKALNSAENCDGV